MVEPAYLSSILSCKCPRCRKGKLFKYKAYQLRKAAIMYEDCTVCKLHFEIEPGFFWGAMYISYAFSVAISVTVAVAFWWLGLQSFWTIMLTIVAVILIFSNVSLRFSRTLMLWFFSGIKFVS